MKNDVITLITFTTSQDEDGFRQEDKRHTLEIMAEVKSARQTEYYQAVQAGMKVTLVMEVNIDDYEAAFIHADGQKVRPTLVDYDGTTFKIVREYRKKRKFELHVQEVE